MVGEKAVSDLLIRGSNGLRYLLEQDGHVDEVLDEDWRSAAWKCQLPLVRQGAKESGDLEEVGAHDSIVSRIALI